MEFNLDVSLEKYAEIALIAGIRVEEKDKELKVKLRKPQ
jgi:hypothetical protein